MDEKQNTQTDNLITIVQLANQKMAAAWMKLGLKSEPPTVSIGIADVVLEAAHELGLSYENLSEKRGNG